MKPILTIFVIIFSLTATSQITKGNWLVGGTGNYNSYNQHTSYGTTVLKGSTFDIMPDIGFFLLDKLATGMQLGAHYRHDVGSSATTYTFGPFVRYYFLPKENRINLFMEGNYEYGTVRFNNVGIISHSSYHNYSFLAGPVIYFNSSVGLELNIGYHHDQPGDNSSFTNSIQVGIGFQIHLEK